MIFHVAVSCSSFFTEHKFIVLINVNIVSSTLPKRNPGETR